MLIAEFRGPYKWLSNFTLVPIKLDEPWEYRSTEHAYMSLKSFDPDWKKTCRDTETCKQIRELGQLVQLRPDWDDVRIASMQRVLDIKFNQEPFRSLLLATNGAHIQEGNKYHDQFWGVDLDTGEGHNHLGRLIMGIRARLRSEGINMMQGI